MTHNAPPGPGGTGAPPGPDRTGPAAGDGHPTYAGRHGPPVSGSPGPWHPGPPHGYPAASYPAPTGHPAVSGGYPAASYPAPGGYPAVSGGYPFPALPHGAAAGTAAGPWSGGTGPYPSTPFVSPPHPGDAWLGPTRFDPVPGTPFAVGYLDPPRTLSGPSAGALVVGIAAVLFALLVGLIGLFEAASDSPGVITGAPAVSAVLLGGGAIGLGLVGLRQFRRAGPVDQRHGRGLAVAGIACGAAGAGLAVLELAAVVLTQLG